jgi:glycerol-3-phosphate acyltransferase PlsX
MGGDVAPQEPVKGAILAAREYGIEVALVGPEELIRAELRKHQNVPRGVEVVPSGDTIAMEEANIVQAVRSRRDASINVAMKLVHDGKAQAVVSAGNTGAVMASAITFLGRVHGVERPAVATLLPYAAGSVLLLDIGANPDPKPLHYVQFAQMGSAYMERVAGVRNPRVGLLNIGEEPNKGNDATKAAHERLSQASGINFVGNIEGVRVHKGLVDVCVTDGFTGNIALKVGEGIADYILQQVRGAIKSSLFFMVGAVLFKPAMKRALQHLSYEEYGGANLLGVNGVVVIAHGRADASALVNAFRVAKQGADSGLIESMRSSMAAMPAAAVAP